MLDFKPRNGYVLFRSLKGYPKANSSTNPMMYGEIEYVSPEADDSTHHFNPVEKIMVFKEDCILCLINEQHHYIIHQSKIVGIFSY